MVASGVSEDQSQVDADRFHQIFASLQISPRCDQIVNIFVLVGLGASAIALTSISIKLVSALLLRFQSLSYIAHSMLLF